MLKAAVRPFQRVQSVLSLLLLLSCAACGRFGFDVQAIDADAAATPGSAGGNTNGDGGSSGGGVGDGSDAGSGQPSMCDALIGAVVCESFEDAQLDGRVETKISDGKLRIDAGALVASIERGGAKAALRWNFDELKQGTFFLRVALTLPERGNIKALSVSTLASSDKDTDIAFKLLSNDRLQVSIQEDARALAGGYEGMRGVPMCLRARIDIDENQGDVRASIDAAQDVRAGNVDTLPGQGISELKVGIGASGSEQGAITLRVHDVVLAASDPGPCP
jgi:hypothetical protein